MEVIGDILCCAQTSVIRQGWAPALLHQCMSASCNVTASKTNRFIAFHL